MRGSDCPFYLSRHPELDSGSMYDSAYPTRAALLQLDPESSSG